mgnify:CR=1 FL=1
MARSGKIIVIAGPTGSGESAVTKAVLKKLKNTKRIITVTTRSPRPHEKNGIDYFFVSTKEFKKMIKADVLLEYIRVPNRNIYYGTVKKQIEGNLAAGINLVGNFEIQGLRYFKKTFPGQVLGIFIKPENISIIKKRFIMRDPTISRLEVQKRIANAKRELAEAKYYDHIVYNIDGNIKKAITEVSGLIKDFTKNTGIDKIKKNGYYKGLIN